MATVHTPDTVKAQMQADIAASNAKTGASDITLHDAVNRLIDGFGKGDDPMGTIKITSNGTHDVAEYAQAEVAVPSTGITPSGTKSITSNGTHDVTSFASASVNVPMPTGLNARVYTVTVTSDVTSGTYTLMAGDDFLVSIRSNPNAFVWVWNTSQAASTAMYSMWIATNFTLMYSGASARNTLVVRTTASANNMTSNYNGLTGNNYSGHLNMTSAGALQIRDCNATYPVKAGTYRIIAGVAEML